MPYSVYTRDQIFSSDDYGIGFQEAYEVFKRLELDPEIKKELMGILEDGGFEDFTVNSIEMNYDEPQDEMLRRIAYAYLLATHHETFEFLRKNNIVLFHGTNSNALPGILKHGMKPFDKLIDEHSEVKSGEGYSRGNGRFFISFTNDLDVASFYGGHKLKGTDAFPVVLGMSKEAYGKQEKYKVHSDVREVGILNGVAIEDIGFIGVPEERVKYVQKLVGDKGIVYSLDRFQGRFYYQNTSRRIIVDEPTAEKFIEKKKVHSSKRLFNKEEVDNLANTRTRSGTKSIFDKLKGLIKGTEKNNIKDDERSGI